MKKKKSKSFRQNRRNHILNRRYLTKIKILTKILQNFSTKASKSITGQNSYFLSLFSKLSAVYDRAIKKNIINKNRAAKKKSFFQRFYFAELGIWAWSQKKLKKKNKKIFVLKI
jgi:ribosomal protein S20